MSSLMTHEQIEDLLLNVIGVTKLMPWKGEKVQFCCPVHGESHPSCGINADFSADGESRQVFHCFSCNASGSIPWLLHKSLPDEYKSVQSAEKFLKERYHVDYHRFVGRDFTLKRYEDHYLGNTVEPRFELPRFTLAPFKSGKETYQYFFDRGFDKEDLQKFMIGRDLENETVTIPAFWEDGTLAGVIGRYIDPNRPKNMRYKIYSFPKGSLIYPLDKLVVTDNTLVGVESMLDVIRMHKWGITNVVALMGDGMSKQQANQIVNRCNKFVALFDHDKGGVIATKIARKALGDRVMFLTPTYYPELGKDSCEWGKQETIKVISSASILPVKKLPKL